jgi:hypothetical protein
LESLVVRTWTGTTCMSLLVQMRTEGRYLLLAGEVAVR